MGMLATPAASESPPEQDGIVTFPLEGDTSRAAGVLYVAPFCDIPKLNELTATTAWRSCGSTQGGARALSC